jgi:hypothetical protein
MIEGKEFGWSRPVPNRGNSWVICCEILREATENVYFPMKGIL